MAKKLSAKKPAFLKTVSHSHRRTNVKKSPNYQTKKINGVKVTLAAREWKTLEKDAS